jgi:NAD(P)H dehydrogenase (quinone)
MAISRHWRVPSPKAWPKCPARSGGKARAGNGAGGCLRASGIKVEQDAPFAVPDELGDYDAVIIGTPTRFGNMAAQMRNFLDQTGGLWMKGALVGKVGSVFTSTASQHGGQESTILSSQVTLMHHGMVIVGLPYSWPGNAQMGEISGGTPYGISTIAGPTDPHAERERARGRALPGCHVAQIAAKLARSKVGSSNNEYHFAERIVAMRLVDMLGRTRTYRSAKRCDTLRKGRMSMTARLPGRLHHTAYVCQESRRDPRISTRICSACRCSPPGARRRSCSARSAPIAHCFFGLGRRQRAGLFPVRRSGWTRPSSARTAARPFITSR